MIYEYQVYYRLRLASSNAEDQAMMPADGPVLSVKVECENNPRAGEDAVATARAVIPEDVGVITAVVRGRPIVDWQKPVFSAAEARVFLDCGSWTFSDLGAEGALPRPNKGSGLYPRTVLDAFVARRMGLAKAA